MWQEERMLRQKLRRQRALFVVSVIIATVCAASLYIGYVAYTYESAITPAPRQEKKERLPQRCHYLLKEQDPEDWDPETETYPPNWAWRECMGIG